jgi:8-oxo-dGTP diphosphatase
MRRVAEIDWAAWTPQERATLLFVVREGRILLIRKKRGLGAGKINGPGGRIEAGETPEQAAVREVREELRTTPRQVSACGELRFQFDEGLSLLVYVFRAADCAGEPEATDEADPLWFDVREIPYAQMWQDDEHWLPLALAGVPFRGYFLFDGDRMLDWRVVRGDRAPPA